MPTIDDTITLADIVTTSPGAARILESFGLDYCCGGARPIDAACRDAGVDVAAVRSALAAAPSEPPADWVTMGPTELVDHLETTHHAYLHTELERLSALAAKVEAAHGARHPEVADVRSTYEALRAELEPHLLKEERVLFPMIRELETATSAPEFHCGTLLNPISVMRAEHEQAGELLDRIRSLSGGFQTPADGCASFRAFYDGLDELEADTHLHIHKENNVLFPMVVALEARLSAAP
ncbi:MAG: iron-sulfur cluster repair di-iron protein [Acidimicrobiia bacterium]